MGKIGHGHFACDYFSFAEGITANNKRGTAAMAVVAAV